MIFFNVEFELAFEARLLDENHRGDGIRTYVMQFMSHKP